MKSKAIINSIGIIFLIFGIAAILNTVLNIEKGFAPILWLSYVCLILLAIGILKRDSSLIASQIAIIGIPYLIWNVDFFYHLISGNGLLGITDYFFKSNSIIDKIISLQHIFNLPLSLIALYQIKLKRTDFWIISVIQITIIFIISRLATTYKENVNCVYHNCANFSFGLPYILEWFLAYAIMIWATAWILLRCIAVEQIDNCK